MEKKNLKYLLISVCFALLIASIGGVIVGASSDEDANLAIKAQTLDVNGKVGIAFAVPKSLYDINSGDIRVSLYSDADCTESIQELDDYSVLLDESGDPKNINGCVAFVSDGFDPYDFADTVYARVETNSAHGPVVKTGVLELAYKMLNSLNGLETLNEAQTTRKNLYTSLIKYHDYVQQVFNADYKPYTYITVDEGLINGDVGGALVKEGDTFTLENTFNAQYLGYSFLGWSADGTIENKFNSTSTVKNAVAGEIQHYEQIFASIDDPYLADGTARGHLSELKAQLNNSATKTITLADDPNYNKTVTSKRTINNFNDSLGGQYVRVDHDKMFAGSRGSELFSLPTTLAPNSSTILSVDIRLFARDYNSDGQLTAADAAASYNKDGTATNADCGNFKLNVGIIGSNYATITSMNDTKTDKTSNVLFDLFYRTTSSKFPNYQIRTSSRILKADGTISVDQTPTAFYDVAGNEWHNIQIEYITDATHVTGVKVYLNGNCIATREMGSDTYNLAVNNNSTDVAMPISAVQGIGFALADSNTFRGCTDLRNFAVYTSDETYYSIDDVKAKVPAPEEYDDVYVGAFDSSHNYSINSVDGYNGLFGYSSTGRVSINVNSGVITETNAIHTNNPATGYSYYLIKNPLNGMDNAVLAGKTFTYSFKMMAHHSDANGNGIWDENTFKKADSTIHVGDFSTATSGATGKIKLGFTDGNFTSESDEYDIDPFIALTTQRGTYGFDVRSSWGRNSALWNNTYMNTLNTTGFGVYSTVTVAVTFDDNGCVKTATVSVVDGDTLGTAKSAVHDHIIEKKDYKDGDLPDNTDSNYLNNLHSAVANDSEYFGFTFSINQNRYGSYSFKDFSYTLTDNASVE